jgi:hypothetical protein
MDYKQEFYEKESSLIYKEENVNYEKYIDLINYKKSKNLDFTIPELNIIVIILFKSLKQLNNFKNDISNNLIENLQMLNKEHKDVNVIIREQKLLIKNYNNQNENCTIELNSLYEYIDYIFTKLDNNDLEKYEIKDYISLYTDICCIYKEYCQDCREGSTRNDDNTKYNFCDECHVCVMLRDCRRKEKSKEAKDLWMEKNSKSKKKTKTQNHIVINNNISITNNSIINNYIITTDRFFEITISDNTVEQLKNIFIWRMCGVKGKDIFPGEKYSLSKTFNVVAASYCIKYIEEKPILHGLIRYSSCNNDTTVTENKLQKLIKSDNPVKKATIHARKLKLWEEDKHKYEIDDIKNVYNQIKEYNHYGSDIKNFLT